LTSTSLSPRKNHWNHTSVPDDDDDDDDDDKNDHWAVIHASIPLNQKMQTSEARTPTQGQAWCPRARLPGAGITNLGLWD